MRRPSVVFLLLACMVFSPLGFGQKKLIALTIDDLPFVGAGKNSHLERILESLIQNNVPATGFIIAGHISPNDWSLLHKFHDAGFGLGNHTFSHRNLNQLEKEAFIQEIDAADRILEPVLSEPKYFRYPYLSMSKGEKRSEILNHLAKSNYQIAPVTIDSKDFMFNQLLMASEEKNRFAFFKRLLPAYIEFIHQQTLIAQSKRKPYQAEILLIHANLLNAYALPVLIRFYKQHGYEFVSLEEALNTYKKPERQIARKPTSRLLAKLESWVDWD